MSVTLPPPCVATPDMTDADEQLRESVRARSGETGSVHSWELVTAVDGPGTRLTVFLAGCALRCQYCHNPDTWTLSNGIPVTLAKAVEEIQRYAPGLKRMNGGFTLSGGEALMQDRFAVRLFEACKAAGVHTALETNGYFGDRLTDDELRLIDLVLLDMKAFSLEQHKRVAGIANEPVIAFAERLAALGRPMWLRYVLVPGLTDVPEEMARLAAFAAGLGVVERAEILPFHQLGAYKWKKLGLDYQLEGTPMPTPAQVDAAIAVFAAAGLKAC